MAGGDFVALALGVDDRHGALLHDRDRRAGVAVPPTVAAGREGDAQHEGVERALRLDLDAPAGDLQVDVGWCDERAARQWRGRLAARRGRQRRRSRGERQ